jgi:hypothetical protein
MNISGKERRQRPSRISDSPFRAAVVFAILVILPAAASAATQVDGGILQREISARHELVSVKLLGVTEYELTEMFNDLLMSAPGVMEAKRCRFRLDPQRPAGCMVEWEARIEGTDASQLEGCLYRMLRHAARQGMEGECTIFAFQPTAEELARFKDIRPWMASMSEIQFVLGHPWRLESRNTGRAYRSGSPWGHVPDAGFE